MKSSLNTFKVSEKNLVKTCFNKPPLLNKKSIGSIVFFLISTQTLQNIRIFAYEKMMAGL